MKPFNLEEYLANPSRKLVTREGRDARIICTDRKSEYPIVALIDDRKGIEYNIHSFTKNGRFVSGQEDPNDLFFAPEKKEGWINIYHGNYRGRVPSHIIYSCEEDANNAIVSGDNYITTIKIEWDE